MKNKEFINHLNNWKFKDVYTETKVIPSKFLGFTYKSRIQKREKEIFYNDFSVFKEIKDGILIDSGADGSYRPEGYMWGSSENTERMRKRLEIIVLNFNNNHSLKLFVINKDGYFFVGGF